MEREKKKKRKRLWKSQIVVGSCASLSSGYGPRSMLVVSNHVFHTFYVLWFSTRLSGFAKWRRVPSKPLLTNRIVPQDPDSRTSVEQLQHSPDTTLDLLAYTVHAAVAVRVPQQ